MKKKSLLIIALSGFLLFAFILKESKPLYIIFIGDSITHGSKFPSQAPPIYAGEYLNKNYKPAGSQISNQGVSGRTTYDFLPGTKLFEKVKMHADSVYKENRATMVFSIMLGTNDSAVTGPKGAPVSSDQYSENLKIIIDSLLLTHPNAKVVIHYPVWYSDNTHNRSTYMKAGQDRVLTYFPQIDNLVKIYGEINPHHVFKGDTKAYNYFEKNYLTDMKSETGGDGVFYLHPNNKGDVALGEFWAKAIIKAIK